MEEICNDVLRGEVTAAQSTYGIHQRRGGSVVLLGSRSATTY